LRARDARRERKGRHDETEEPEGSEARQDSHRAVGGH
jgi:hypothetical protein